MTTCNICKGLKGCEEMVLGFRYICKDCWKKMKITIDDEKVDKELVY